MEHGVHLHGVCMQIARFKQPPQLAKQASTLSCALACRACLGCFLSAFLAQLAAARASLDACGSCILIRPSSASRQGTHACMESVQQFACPCMSRHLTVSCNCSPKMRACRSMMSNRQRSATLSLLPATNLPPFFCTGTEGVSTVCRSGKI